MNDDITLLTHLSSKSLAFHDVSDFLNVLGYTDDTVKIDFLQSLVNRGYISVRFPSTPIFQTGTEIRASHSMSDVPNTYLAKLEQPGKEYLREHQHTEKNVRSNKMTAKSTFWYVVITVGLLLIALYQCK